MNTRGRLKDISLSLSGKMIISFETERISQESIDMLRGCDDLDVTAEKHRVKRSINANSYFHVLCARIAEKTGNTQTHEKNSLIRDCGYWRFVDGKIPTITMKPEYEDGMLDFEGLHVKVVERHTDFVKFGFLRGSHELDSVEMSHLIDLTVEAAQALGIETLTPEQIGRMISSWGKVND